MPGYTPAPYQAPAVGENWEIAPANEYLATDDMKSQQFGIMAGETFTASQQTGPKEDASLKERLRDARNHDVYYRNLVASTQQLSIGAALPLFIVILTLPSLWAAGSGNDQAMLANQIALLTFCSQVGNLTQSNTCATILQDLDSYLPSLASQLFKANSSASTILTPTTVASANIFLKQFAISGNRDMTYWVIIISSICAPIILACVGFVAMYIYQMIKYRRRMARLARSGHM